MSSDRKAIGNKSSDANKSDTKAILTKITPDPFLATMSTEINKEQKASIDKEIREIKITFAELFSFTTYYHQDCVKITENNLVLNVWTGNPDMYSAEVEKIVTHLKNSGVINKDVKCELTRKEDRDGLQNVIYEIPLNQILPIEKYKNEEQKNLILQVIQQIKNKYDKKFRFIVGSWHKNDIEIKIIESRLIVQTELGRSFFNTLDDFVVLLKKSELINEDFKCVTSAHKSKEKLFFEIPLNQIPPIEKAKQAMLDVVANCDVDGTKNALNALEGINFNEIRNTKGETLLMLAASGNRNTPHEQSYEVVKLLLNAGVDPLSTSNDRRTALMDAANFGRTSVVNLLLDSVPPEKRIDYINQSDNVGSTAKSYAGQSGHFIDVHKQIGKVLEERIEQTNAEMTNQKSAPTPGGSRNSL